MQKYAYSKTTIKSKMMVRSFPGAKIEDIKHYCVPVLASNPKHVIAHGGKNDLRNRNSQEITKQMGELCDLILNICPDTHITVSSLTTRNDVLSKKVTEVNEQLKSLCLKKKLRLQYVIVQMTQVI